eukprot:Selendium_serpulae@DN1314_c0_g1_i1.p1
MRDVVDRLTRTILSWDSGDAQETTEGQVFVDICTNSSGSRLMEALVKNMSKAHFEKLVLSCLTGNGAKLACHRVGNFVLSHMLLCPHLEEPTLELIIKELDGADGILEAQTGAVLWRVADACRRLQCHHKRFVRILLKLLRCDQTASYTHIFPSILAMSYREATDPEGTEAETKASFNNTGCSILAALTFFPKTALAPVIAGLKSFLAQPASWFVALAKDKQGSRVVEALIAPGSTMLDLRGVDRLSRRFDGHYATMALHPHSAYVVSAFYRAVKLKRKAEIVKELLKIHDTLKDANYSLYRRCEVPLFKMDKAQWMEAQSKKLKARSMFDSLLKDDGAVGSLVVPSEDKGDTKQKSNSGTHRFRGNNGIEEDAYVATDTGGVNRKRKSSKKELNEAVAADVDQTVDDTDKSRKEKKRKKREKAAINEQESAETAQSNASLDDNSKSCAKRTRTKTNSENREAKREKKIAT